MKRFSFTARRFRDLFELCAKIDARRHLLDVQCEEDEKLVAAWRIAYSPSEKTQPAMPATGKMRP